MKQHSTHMRTHVHNPSWGAGLQHRKWPAFFALAMSSFSALSFRVFSSLSAFSFSFLRRFCFCSSVSFFSFFPLPFDFFALPPFFFFFFLSWFGGYVKTRKTGTVCVREGKREKESVRNTLYMQPVLQSEYEHKSHPRISVCTWVLNLPHPTHRNRCFHHRFLHHLRGCFHCWASCSSCSFWICCSSCAWCGCTQSHSHLCLLLRINLRLLSLPFRWSLRNPKPKRGEAPDSSLGVWHDMSQEVVFPGYVFWYCWVYCMSHVALILD